MTFWTPEIVQRLDQVCKSFGSFAARCGLRWVLGGLTGTISSLAVPEKTAKAPKKLTFGYQNHKLSAWPLLYLVLMADIWNFCDTFLGPKSKHTFLFFKMLIRCWDTRVQSYPSSASKIKSTNCLAWPHLYFLFMADGWNFCDTLLSPWNKNTLLFFKILIRYWDTGV